MFKLGLTGEFEIYSNKRGLLAKFSNLILNQGLEYLATSGFPNYIYVGSGNVPPTVNDTAMGNFIAKSNGSSPRITNTYGAATTSAPYYAWTQIAVRFAEGVAAGNLSEVGIGSSTTLVARALIKDSSGNPTTITILSDEILDIAYTMKLYVPTNDVSGTLNLTGNIGGSYGWTMRAARATYASYVSESWCLYNSNFNSAGIVTAYTGPIDTIVNQPSGTAGAGTITVDAYVANSRKVTGTITFTASAANFGTGIKSLLFTPGPGMFQVEFSPAIPKTSLDQVTLRFEFTFGRYGE